MNYLIKSAKIIEKGSSLDGQLLDILIKDGLIVKIASNIVDVEAQLIQIPGLNVSAGWFDMRCHGRVPGLEHKEDMHSLEAAALNGGFTDVALLPNTQPIAQTKDVIAYVKALSQMSKVNFWPMAAATHNSEGKDINEYIDLSVAGAVAFTDGERYVDKPATITKILQYLNPLCKVFINHPTDNQVNAYGLMHEGLNSNLLGLKGMPAYTEAMAIERDINILKYLGFQSNSLAIHFSLITSAQSVEVLRKAKAEGFKFTADVSLQHLLFTENNLHTFDSAFKLNPPLRSEQDRQALWQGLKDGTIDVIVSDHQPHDPEAKDMEFDMAEFGVSAIDSFFPVLNKNNSTLKINELIEKITAAPRKVLGVEPVRIREGFEAQLTLFTPATKWVQSMASIKSMSKSSPYIGHDMLGKVIGVFNKKQLIYVD